MDNKNVSGPEALFQMLQAHHVTAVLTTAIDLGLFAAVHDGAHDAAAIAAKIQCPERTTRVVAEALAVLGLLTKDGERYSLGPIAAEHLVPGKPQYLGGVSSIMGSEHLWRAMTHLKESVKAGGSVLPEHAETPQLPFWEIFAKSTVGMSVPAAMAIQGILAPWLASRSAPTALDVAAGSGTYGFTLVKENPALRATLLDWPNVLVETRQMAGRLGVDSSRVQFIEGNLFEAPFGGPYDVIVMSHILHHFEPTVCQSLLKKAAAALKPDGKLVIHDFLIDGDNPAARMFSITMLGTTKKGQAFASSDYGAWSKAAGLGAFKVYPAAGLPSSIMVAERG
ncbi:class I SAM-dependent methyltransferase [Pendulispora brunnea]|uniref:Class I SAM-dependent methyltransferase n=1 Tax=Pendulispora brunnea TaxID=2905690 RepID=A0ABZ2JUV2_9BACT